MDRGDRRTPLRAARALSGVLALGLLTACGAGEVTTADPGPTPSASPSASPGAPDRTHGRVVDSEPFDGQIALDAATNTYVTYRQVGVREEEVVSSAVVSVPDDREAPEGGWPVLVWSHGSTGIADRCAPSGFERDPGDTGERPGDMRQDFLRAGYAVVQPDYEGLGTPGTHPYMIGPSAGRSVLDAALAAREVDDSIGDAVTVAGHSQGAHATLWAAGLAADYAPEIDLRGAAAIAPPTGLAEQLPDVGSVLGPGGIAVLLVGARERDPAVRPGELLQPVAARLLDDVRSECFDDLDRPDSFGGLDTVDTLRPGADLSAALAVLEESDPATLEIAVPVLVVQGRQDFVTPAEFTDRLVEALRGRGTDVTYAELPDDDHSSVLETGAADVDAFVRGVLDPPLPRPEPSL